MTDRAKLKLQLTYCDVKKTKLTIGNGRKFEDRVKWNTKIWKFSCREKKESWLEVLCYSKYKTSL